MKNRQQYIDRIWWERYKNLDSNTGKYLIDYNSPTLIIDEEKKSIKITYGKNWSQEKIIEVRKKFKKKLSGLTRLSEEIKTKEKNKLVREYYLKKIEELKTRINIWLIKQSSSLSIEERNSKIANLCERIYPIPTPEEMEMFVNEFISFVKYLDVNSDLKLNKALLKELSDPKFYNVKDQNLKIDFSKSFKNYQEYKNKNAADFEKLYTSNEVKIIFERLISKIGLSKYSKIQIRKKYLFSVDENQNVKVPKNYKKAKARLIELMGHEILVHVVRGVNGKKNKTHEGKKLRMLKNNILINLYIEEGLASYFERNLFYNSDKYDIANNIVMYIRTIGVYLGLHFDPYTVYQKLLKLQELFAVINNDYETKIAKTTMQRIYRDFSDLTTGCVNGKVTQYLYGDRKVWEFVQSGGNINNLFAGKIIPEQIGELKKLGFEVPEELFGSKDFPREKVLQMIEECFNTP